MQIHTSLHDDHAQPGSWDFANVLAPVKSFKQSRLIFVRDANALIANLKERLGALPGNAKRDFASIFGVFDRVGKEVGEDMTQEGFVAVDLAMIGHKIERDRALGIGRG